MISQLCSLNTLGGENEKLTKLAESLRIVVL